MPISLRDRLLGRTQPAPEAKPEPANGNGHANGHANGNGSTAAAPEPGTATAPADERLAGQVPPAAGAPGASRTPPAQPAVPGSRSELPVPVPKLPTTTNAPKLGTFAKMSEAASVSAVDQLKVDLHRKLVDRLDLTALERITDEQVLTTQIRQAVAEFLRAEQAPLSAAERDEIVEQIIYEVTGLGPIEPLVRDPTVSDILVNGPRDVYVERRGKLTRTPIVFRDNAHLLAVIDRIVSRVGRRVDESSPMVDARLPDGSRVNAIIPPLALDGAVLSIRRFGAKLEAQKLVEFGALTQEMLDLLRACVIARLNIMISGGTGAGKTTLLNALSSFIPDHERIVTIEDAAELRLQQDHIVRLETRPPNSEGRGEVVARDLVKNALRMRPDRIVVGEVRGGEALDMLQAMNTGHEGSMTTLHANTPRDAIARLETMILFAGTNLPNKAMREQISSALDLIVQVSRMADGSRRITSITEITNMEGDIITAQEIFRYRKRGIAADGSVVGHFEATGVRPTFLQRIQVAGVELPTDMFAMR